MTVASTTARLDYAGDGSSKGFPVGFYFLENSHLAVYLRDANGAETLKQLSNDYTVNGAGEPSGGTVTFITAPPAGTSVVIMRNVPLTQDVDYPRNDPFPAATHERAIDKLTMIVQQLSLTLARTLRIAPTDTDGSINAIPSSTARANRTLVFDADGNITVSADDYTDNAAAAAASALAAEASAISASDAVGDATDAVAAANAQALAAQASAVAAAASAQSAIYSIFAGVRLNANNELIIDYGTGNFTDANYADSNFVPGNTTFAINSNNELVLTF